MSNTNITEEKLTAIENALKDVQFQLAHVKTWVDKNKFTTAFAKSEYLSKAANNLENALRNAVQ